MKGLYKYKPLKLFKDNEFQCHSNYLERQILQRDRFRHIMKIKDKEKYYNMVYTYLDIEKPAKKQYQEKITKHKSLLGKEFIYTKNIEKIQTFIQPQKDKKPTIVLDLDKTLLFSTDYSQNTQCSCIYYDDGLYTSYRNHLKEFMSFIDQFFEIIIWSAGENQYVRNRVQFIQQFATQPIIALSRAACTVIKGAYIKDLRVLGRDLKNTILLDDNYISCAFQYENCIPINEFEGQQEEELLQIIPFLQKILGYSCLVYGLERQLVDK